MGFSKGSLTGTDGPLAAALATATGLTVASVWAPGLMVVGALAVVLAFAGSRLRALGDRPATRAPEALLAGGLFAACAFAAWSVLACVTGAAAVPVSRVLVTSSTPLWLRAASVLLQIMMLSAIYRRLPPGWQALPRIGTQAMFAAAGGLAAVAAFVFSRIAPQAPYEWSAPEHLLLAASAMVALLAIEGYLFARALAAWRGKEEPGASLACATDLAVLLALGTLAVLALPLSSSCGKEWAFATGMPVCALLVAGLILHRRRSVSVFVWTVELAAALVWLATMAPGFTLALVLPFGLAACEATRRRVSASPAAGGSRATPAASFVLVATPAALLAGFTIDLGLTLGLNVVPVIRCWNAACFEPVERGIAATLATYPEEPCSLTFLAWTRMVQGRLPEARAIGWRCLASARGTSGSAGSLTVKTLRAIESLERRQAELAAEYRACAPAGVSAEGFVSARYGEWLLGEGGAKLMGPTQCAFAALPYLKRAHELAPENAATTGLLRRALNELAKGATDAATDWPGWSRREAAGEISLAYEVWAAAL